MKKVINFWLKSANENFVTAKAMYKTGRWSFVFFMCQQTVEAILKAVYVIKKKEPAPFLHSLSQLAVRCELDLPAEFAKFLSALSRHYIETRYMNERFNKNVFNKKTAAEIIKNTEKVMKWLIQEEKLKI